MEVEYAITPEDAAAFQRYHLKASLSSPRFFVMRLVPALADSDQALQFYQTALSYYNQAHQTAG